MEWVGKQVAPQKKVRLVEEIDEIPKSPSGKILRRVLKDREPARERRLSRPGAMLDPAPPPGRPRPGDGEPRRARA